MAASIDRRNVPPPSATSPTATSERLVDAALEAFAERGLANVTLDEIARRAGVHRVTLHRNFPGGRDELVLAVLHREVLRLATAAIVAIDAAPDVAQALTDAIVVFYDGMRERGTLSTILADPGTRSALHGPAAAAITDLGVLMWQQLTARAAEEGRATTSAGAPEVVDFIVRVGTSLVAEPGSIRTSRQVRRWIAHFLIPSLLPSVLSTGSAPPGQPHSLTSPGTTDR